MLITQKMMQQSKEFCADSEIIYKPKKYYFKGGGGSSSGSQTTTTVQKADPWSGQQPYLSDVFSQAQNQYYDKSTPSYYPNSTVVPFSPQTQQALDLQQNRALNGSPVETAANQQLTDTLNGNYLYGGSGFNAAYNAAANQIIPQVNSMFNNSGRTNSGLAQTAMTQALSDAFAGQYGNERENQMRAEAFAPTAINQDYTDISKLADVGSQNEELSSENLQDAINRYNFAQNLPAAKLQEYNSLIQGTYGGTTNGEATSPLYRGNSASGILGGALGGAGLASKLGASAAGAGIAGPWGLALGAIGGGLLGGL
jgi:hypothetical protein